LAAVGSEKLGNLGRSADRVILDLDALGEDGLGGLDYHDDDEIYEEDGTAPLLSSRFPTTVRNPAKPKPPDWQKALMFSQFTSLLNILRTRLNQDGILYECLDGATRDRQTRVERFQNDKDCRLFLVSMKAGGLGLNLTAAEYVFILDPWWNPAVEAQAVDRAHRIGQTRPIFAYRLIARDTVEEKVLELQKTKRDLAAAIIGAENSRIRDLRSEDLALLRS